MGSAAGFTNLTIDLDLRTKAGVNYTCEHCERMSAGGQKRPVPPVSHRNLKVDSRWKFGEKYFYTATVETLAWSLVNGALAAAPVYLPPGRGF